MWRERGHAEDHWGACHVSEALLDLRAHWMQLNDSRWHCVELKSQPDVPCPGFCPTELSKNGLPGGSHRKESVCNAGDPGSIPGLGRSPGERNGIHSSILAWRIPWTEEPGGLQSMGSKKVRHCWATNTFFSLLSHLHIGMVYCISIDNWNVVVWTRVLPFPN